MFIMWVLVVLLFGEWGVSAELSNEHTTGCQLSRVPVQPNFDIQRYVGRWNELLWLAPYEEKEYDATDYFWTFNVTSEGVIDGYSSGRDLYSGACFGGPLKMNETDTPGVLLLDAHNGYITRYYIMDTDYDTYANVYGCYDYSSDDSLCYRGRAWLWMRGTTMSTQLRGTVVKSWQRLCLDVYNTALLKETRFFGNECPVGN